VNLAPFLDIVFAGVLLVRALANINAMRLGTTKHCYRALNIVVAVAALGVILTAFSGGEVRYYAHIAITGALAILVVIGRRQADKLSA
jgi:hypothetical protein